MSDIRSRNARQFIEAIPHARALGMRLDAVGDGVAELSMPYDERFVGDPATRVIHGGAVFALMDTCCGTAVLNHPSGVKHASVSAFLFQYPDITPGPLTASSPT